MLAAPTEAMDPARRERRRRIIEGQEEMWPMAMRLGVKLAWGTDLLCEPELSTSN